MWWIVTNDHNNLNKKFSFVNSSLKTESNLNKLLKIHFLKTLSWLSARCLMIGLFLLSFQAIAQDNWDNGKIKHREFDNAKIEDYKKDKRFQYQEIRRPTQPSFMYRLSEWIWRNIVAPLSNPKKHPVRGTIYYIIIAGILIYAILKLINADISLFGSKKAQSQVTFSEVEENIHEMDFNQLIEEAKSKQNYRRAVRLLYLQILKKLSDKALINWQIDKTNHEYERELLGTSLYNGFQDVTLRFEYFCYGDFQIDRTSFDRTEPLFQEFSSKLAQVKTKATQAAS